MPSLNSLSVDVQPAVESYFATYAARSARANETRAFQAESQNALLALSYLWLGERLAPRKRSVALDSMERAARDVFEHSPRHTFAVDICGFVWASAYGSMPLPEPPLPYIEWAYVSGSGAGAVSGLLGSAWRALFLVAAWPYFSFHHRHRVASEIDRRLPYVVERVGSLIDLDTPRHQIAHAAFVATELERLIPGVGLASASEQLVAHLVADQAEDGSLPSSEGRAPTGQMAQFVLAAAGARQIEARDKALRFILRERSSVGGQILVRDDTDDLALELSPWVTLALLTVDRPELSRPRVFG